jgi:hypothetical protein
VFLGNSLTKLVFLRIVLKKWGCYRLLQIMRNKTLWHVLLVMLCALVFFFALHAKTAVYNGGASVKLTPSTASKLWLNGQKMEVQSVEASGSALFWMAALCLFGAYFRREPALRSVFLAPSPRHLSLQFTGRFLRPPPRFQA